MVRVFLVVFFFGGIVCLAPSLASRDDDLWFYAIINNHYSPFFLVFFLVRFVFTHLNDYVSFGLLCCLYACNARARERKIPAANDGDTEGDTDTTEGRCGCAVGVDVIVR